MKTRTRWIAAAVVAAVGLVGAGSLALAGRIEPGPAEAASRPAGPVEAAAGDGLRASSPMTTATASPPITPTETLEPTLEPTLAPTTALTPTATSTFTPSATPTRPAYIPFTGQRVGKAELPAPWLRFRPRSMARPLRLPTLDGQLAIDPGDPGDASYVFIGRHPASLLSQQLWDASVDALLDTSPEDVNYVFMAYEASPAEAEARVRAQRERIAAVLAGRPAEQRGHWEEHLHYVKVNPMTLDSWFTNVLEDWGSSNPQARASWQENGQTVEIQFDTTADSGWARRIGPDAPMEGSLAWFGTACNGETPAQDVAGKIALVERGVCPFTDKAVNAERLGATGMVMFTDDRPKTEMGGSGSVGISVVMIDRDHGLRMRDQVVAGNAVQVSISAVWAQAHGLAIDHTGHLREFGWIPYGFPTYHEHQFDLFEQVAYEAQSYHHEHGIEARMAAEEAAGEVEVIPVFEGVMASDPGWTGRRFVAEIELPSAAEMQRYDKLEVDLKMGCRNGEDDNCGAWDYLVYLYLCDDPDNPNACNNEVGRFITAYKRQTHWVTDISPMLGYFQQGGKVRLGFWTVQPYVLDMDLRLGKSAAATAAGGANLVPRQLVPLFGDRGRFDRRFDEHYNDVFQPITFTVPAGIQKVELVTIISGHGFAVDDKQCAEFCNHTHRFTVNGDPDSAVFIDHPIMDDPVGADIGCALQVPAGVAPNQFGTWPFGRAAWCPGLDVPVKRHDITSQVQIGGADNVIDYFGGFRGEAYVPVLAPGVEPGTGWDMRIEMKSFLLYWAAP